MIETILFIIFAIVIIGIILGTKIVWGLIIARGLELNSDKIKIDYWGRQFQIVDFMIKNPFKEDKQFTKLVILARILFSLMILLAIIALILRS